MTTTIMTFIREEFVSLYLEHLLNSAVLERLVLIFLIVIILIITIIIIISIIIIIIIIIMKIIIIIIMMIINVGTRFRAFYLGFHSVCASNALIMLRPEEVPLIIMSLMSLIIMALTIILSECF